MRVAVIGTGIVGLSTALVLADAGHDPILLSPDAPAATVSAVAGGLWSPFRAGPPAAVARWSRVGYERHAALAASTPAAGVRMLPTTIVVPDADVPHWWEACAPPGIGRRATPDERPAGCSAARVLTVGLVDTARHLAWLEARLAGVKRVRARLAALQDAFAHADCVVACPGLGARELLGDPSVHALRGVVVEVEDPGGIAGPLLDDTGAQPTYILPRTDGTVLLGGRVDVGDERPEPTPEEIADVHARCSALVPSLAGARVRSVRAGLRPGRPEVRVGELPHAAGRVLVNYGHGGCGWTLAHGCAQDVLALL